MQLATLLIGLMSATALWSGVQAINGQARSSYDRAANVRRRNAMLVPTHDVTVPQSLFAELRRAGWLVSPVIEGSVRIGGRAINLVGVEPLSLPRSGIIAPDVEQSLQDFLSPAGQTLIAPETAAELRLHEGATVATEAGERLPPLHITAGFAPNMLVTDIGFAQRILRKPERISRFLIDPEPAGARAALQDVAGDRLRLVEAGSETDLQRLTASFHLNLTAFGLLSFLSGSSSSIRRSGSVSSSGCRCCATCAPAVCRRRARRGADRWSWCRSRGRRHRRRCLRLSHRVRAAA